MNLLLLLSALLSALTGVGTGARPAQAAVAVTRLAQPSTAARDAAPQVSVRPTVAAAREADVLSIDRPAWALAPAAPLYLSRRRE